MFTLYWNSIKILTIIFRFCSIHLVFEIKWVTKKEKNLCEFVIQSFKLRHFFKYKCAFPIYSCHLGRYFIQVNCSGFQIGDLKCYHSKIRACSILPVIWFPIPRSTLLNVLWLISLIWNDNATDYLARVQFLTVAGKMLLNMKLYNCLSLT